MIQLTKNDGLFTDISTLKRSFSRRTNSMTKLKADNQTRQKVLTAHGIELLPHFFSAVVDTFKVECAYCVYGRLVVMVE